MMLYVGRVAHEKNIGFLLIVAKLLSDVMPDVLLVIAGEGPALSSLRNSVKEHSIENNVQFIGYLDRNTQLNSCYKAADVFVFSSKSETQGLVILEAMAQGTPVVAIAELGTASILIEGKGALISTENESEFVQKVHSILINPQRRQQLSEAAFDYGISNLMIAVHLTFLTSLVVIGLTLAMRQFERRLAK
jgi:glycosyltransferase involved in cell wall biosynthesis